MRFSKLFSVAICIVLATVLGIAQEEAEPALVKDIKGAIVKVRSNKTVDTRTEAAEHLATLTRKIPAKEVTQSLVIDIMSLLDSSDDSVRYWVARALGNIGPSAKAAIPKLEELLPEADCMNGSITSASGIRYALIRMGVKPPPPPKCVRIAG